MQLVELKTTIPMPVYKTDGTGIICLQRITDQLQSALTPRLGGSHEWYQHRRSGLDSKHFVGTELITSPYKLIAADVDKMAISIQ